jgi:cell shape-determining protein MreC
MKSRVNISREFYEKLLDCFNHVEDIEAKNMELEEELSEIKLRLVEAQEIYQEMRRKITSLKKREVNI